MLRKYSPSFFILLHILCSVFILSFFSFHRDKTVNECTLMSSLYLILKFYFYFIVTYIFIFILFILGYVMVYHVIAFLHFVRLISPFIRSFFLKRGNIECPYNLLSSPITLYLHVNFNIIFSMGRSEKSKGFPSSQLVEEWPEERYIFTL